MGDLGMRDVGRGERRRRACHADEGNNGRSAARATSRRLITVDTRPLNASKGAGANRIALDVAPESLKEGGLLLLSSSVLE